MNLLRRRAFSFLGKFDQKIRTKFNNVSGKTGQYDVPDTLFQKRTSRSNRVLISWKTVFDNNLSYEQLNGFEAGVVVDFINDDFFSDIYKDNKLYNLLKTKLGSDERVSAMISMRSETGTSSSATQRKFFDKLVDNTEVIYNGEKVTITKDNFRDYKIKRKETHKSLKGNEHWEGFIYISIRGGQQDVIQSHSQDENQNLFNPACEYANDEIKIDLDLVVAYFALISVNTEKLSSLELEEYKKLLTDVEYYLANSEYDSEAYKGNLLDYCKNHPSASMKKEKLFDPIQVAPIEIEDFAIDDKQDERNIDFTHDEAVNKERFYWDTKKKTILSPARPANVFWSKHLSNMMQQNFSLKEYFEHEEAIVKRRNELLGRKYNDSNKIYQNKL